jgi:PAS domain S-box-containing protein
MPAIVNKSNAQKTAEADVQGFKNSLGPFVVAAETTRMAMVFMDAKRPGHPIIFANDSFLELTGYAREEVLGQRFEILMAREDDSEARAKIAAEFEGAADGYSEIGCRRRNGTEFWAALVISPVRDESGDIVQHFASLVDLTRHKDEEKQSKMLIDELNHRVKNTLATVQSIVWQAMRTGSNPELQREAIQSRLLALSRSHDLLTRENWKSAGLRDVVEHALKPFLTPEGYAKRISISGDDIRFPPKSALTLAIAFNELATNATKYGALSNDAGSVLIVWAVESAPEGRQLVLRWEEKGGAAVTPPSRRGFGSRMLERGLAHELGGAVHLDYLPGGLVCTISVPAP